MQFAWVGLYAEGIPALDALLAAAAPIAGVVTLRPDLAAQRRAHGNYQAVCARYRVPLHHVTDINGPAAADLFTAMAPDVVFVIGWPQQVRPATLGLARIGMIGAHASLLPRYWGSAPITWAMIRGERETGQTLFWLGPRGAPEGLIDQRSFPITIYDTCTSLYGRVADATREMVLGLVPRLMAGERPGASRPLATDPKLPRRRPADGRIDWTHPSWVIYDLIRALTRPAPGAFSVLDGRPWRIWSAALPPTVLGEKTIPGAIVGPVVSPTTAGCGLLVTCGTGAIVLLELEDEHGVGLSGRSLSSQPWTGRCWHDQ